MRPSCSTRPLSNGTSNCSPETGPTEVTTSIQTFLLTSFIGLTVFPGNDSIVAFARLKNVSVVIHQLNEPLWQVHGSADGATPCEREVHISYHNGDHYNSVRRIGELNSTDAPNIKISVQEGKGAQSRGRSRSKSPGGYEAYANGGGSDYENFPKEDADKISEVLRLTGKS